MIRGLPHKQTGPAYTGPQRSDDELLALARRFTAARYALTDFIMERVAGLGQYIAVPDAPSSYDEIRAEMIRFQGGEPFRVSSLNCDRTIFFTPEGNYACRFWHDMMHALCGGDFSYQGEYKTARFQLAAVACTLGRDSDVYKLLQIDTIEQLDYFHIHGKFVDDQLDFAWAKFQEVAW